MIVGGSRAAYAAAFELRRHKKDCQIVIVEQGAHPGADVCSIPNRMMSGFDDFANLASSTVTELRDRYQIDVRGGQEVVAVDTGNETVTINDTNAGREVTLKYDQLVFATGSRGRRPDLPGADRSDLVSVRNTNDASKLLGTLKDKPGRVAVLGGDYTTLLVAEALVMRGIEVTVVTPGEEVFDQADPMVGAVVSEAITKHGATVRVGESVSGFEPGVIYLKDDAISCDMVLLGLGSEANTDLAHQAGLTLGARRAIVTDRRQQTTVAGIWAAGDCCETRHLVSGERGYWPGALAAAQQGQVAGANLGDHYAVSPGTLGTISTRLFGIEVARTGLNELDARNAGFDAAVVTVEGQSRADTFAGGRALTVRLTYDRFTSRVLGAEIVGEEGVAAPLATAVAAITGGLTTAEVASLDGGHVPSRSALPSPLTLAALEASES